MTGTIFHVFRPLSIWSSIRTAPVVLLLTVASAMLIIANLDNSYLWQDEAQTALISRTIIDHGIPLGFDGVNYFSQEAGAEYGSTYVWKWHPWLPFYILALFFKLFGTSTFIARLPFALFGIATILLLYRYVREVWDQRAAALASLLLMVNVPFLLLVRQCRYYSLTAFFSLLCLKAYHSLCSGKRHGMALLVLSLSLLFHSFYVYCLPVIVTLVAHSLLLNRKVLRPLLQSLLLWGVINLPWFIWFRDLAYGKQYDQVHSLQQFLDFATDYFGQMRMFLFPWPLLALLVAIPVVNRLRRHSFFRERGEWYQRLFVPVLFLVTTVLTLSVASPAPFFRYLAPVIPLVCLIAGLMFQWCMELHPSLGIAAVTALVAVSPMKDYLYELTHEFKGPIRGIVTYLKNHQHEGRVVAANYEDLPLKFYTNLRVIGALAGEDVSGARDADWIVVRKNVIGMQSFNFTQYLEQAVDWSRYEPVVLDYPDTAFENRESPDKHLYRTREGGDRVVIYRRRKTG